MKNKISLLFVCALLLWKSTFLMAKTLNVVTDYGADSTGATYATTNIQNAIDACQSGDTLLIPAGYLSDE